MTSAVNLVLTEVTSAPDSSAVYALGVFLMLFAALLARDIHLFRTRASVGGGRTMQSPSLNYATVYDPDDAAASESLMTSFDRRARWDMGSPITGRSSSDRLVGYGAHGSAATASAAHGCLFTAAQKMIRILTTPVGMMVVPMAFVAITGVAVLLCFVILTDNWSAVYPAGVKVFIYTILATSLLFTLAYLFVTIWRLLKIFGQMVLDVILVDAHHHTPSSHRVHDICDLLSQFANTPLIRSVAQVRIMGMCAAISGIYFGHMFGALDKEDTTKR